MHEHELARDRIFTTIRNDSRTEGIDDSNIWDAINNAHFSRITDVEWAELAMALLRVVGMTDRRRDEIARICMIMPHEVDHMRVKCCLMAEHKRGLAGHWTYDMSRHIGLVQALTDCRKAGI